MTFCGKFESLLFPRTMEHRASWKSSQNRVQDYGRIERFGGSISFIMHHRKPGAVLKGSPRCSEGDHRAGEGWGTMWVRGYLQTLRSSNKRLREGESSSESEDVETSTRSARTMRLRVRGLAKSTRQTLQGSSTYQQVPTT